ncbi:MAG: component of SufBCD complex [Paracoccaceae bacterium]|nr:component of SufBCD complex [Paracoccaceae bacterium]
MHIFDTVLELINMRSFSNLWYWIALAVTWSSASHWVLGVPFDMVLRARRRGGRAAEDLVTLTRVNVARLLMIGREGGMVLSVVASFVLTSLGVLGFGYHMEFAQAVFLMAFPLAFVGLLSLRAAARFEPLLENGVAPDAVAKMLARHRVSVQAVGMVAILVTTMWGMLQNFSISVLG